MLLGTKRSISNAAMILCALGLVWYLWSEAPACTLNVFKESVHEQQSFTPDLSLSNATLGFGAIYVLSADPASYRVQGLIEAANLTGLHMTITVPEHLTDETLHEQVKQRPEWGWGHARAALGHVSILDSLARSEIETALILEDDADFGINIRAHMEAVSQAIANRSDESWTPGLARHHPYREDEWDIFWLGHAGLGHVGGTQVFEYDDPHALPWKSAFSVWNGYYEQIAAGHRGAARPRLIYNVQPFLGSYAYATTRVHAARMVERYMAEDSWLRKDGLSFDFILSRDCQNRLARCVAPAPELFHHQQVPGEKKINEGGSRGMQDMAWYKQQHKYTYNINWSARCNAAQSGERIGNRWQCLPNKGDPLDDFKGDDDPGE